MFRSNFRDMTHEELEAEIKDFQDYSTLWLNLAKGEQLTRKSNLDRYGSDQTALQDFLDAVKSKRKREDKIPCYRKCDGCGNIEPYFNCNNTKAGLQNKVEYNYTLNREYVWCSSCQQESIVHYGLKPVDEQVGSAYPKPTEVCENSIKGEQE